MYDIIIIGGGCAGITAAIYAKEANKSVLVLEKMGVGGQLNNIFNVTNYPGFSSIDGFELAEKMRAQAIGLGAEIKSENVVDVELLGDVKMVTTTKNNYQSKNVVIATGAYARTLGVPNESYYYGKGLSYCATCDGNLFRGKTVAVVGGGNSSIDDCLYLANVAKKVYIIHRRDQFTAGAKDFGKVKALSEGENKIIEFKTNRVVTSIIGEQKINKIEVLNKITNEKEIIDVDGLFVAIGRKPDTELFEGKINLTPEGFIETNEYMETNVEGVYAIGDVRNTVLRQIITACADGAIAINSIVKRR